MHSWYLAGSVTGYLTSSVKSAIASLPSTFSKPSSSMNVYRLIKLDLFETVPSDLMHSTSSEKASHCTCLTIACIANCGIAGTSMDFLMNFTTQATVCNSRLKLLNWLVSTKLLLLSTSVVGRASPTVQSGFPLVYNHYLRTFPNFFVFLVLYRRCLWSIRRVIKSAGYCSVRNHNSDWRVFWIFITL